MRLVCVCVYVRGRVFFMNFLFKIFFKKKNDFLVLFFKCMFVFFFFFLVFSFQFLVLSF